MKTLKFISLCLVLISFNLYARESTLTDLDPDCTINISDLGMFSQWWRTGEALADFDGSGLVDGDDLILFSRDWMNSWSCEKIDYWATTNDMPDPNQTYYDFAGRQIPADFFDPNSQPFSGIIDFFGDPFNACQSDADTLLKRFSDPITTIDPIGTQRTIPVEIINMSLQSVDPISVTYTDRPDELWDVRMTLSKQVQSDGTITALKTHDNGGVFDATFFITPYFTFTRRSDNAFRAFDTDQVWPPGVFEITDAHFVHETDSALCVYSDPESQFIPCVEETTPGTLSSQVRDNIPIPAVGAQQGKGPGVITLCYLDPTIDLDIDSDNNSALGGPHRSPEEDTIEGAPPGKFIGLNDDDDSLNGTIDFQEEPLDPNENDLVPIVIEFHPNTAPGKWNLVYPNSVDVYDSGNVRIVSGVDYDCPLDPNPMTARVEGLSPSTTLGEVGFTLNYDYDGDGIFEKLDLVRATVVKVDLWVYKSDGTTEVSAADEDDPGPGAYVAYNNDDDDADGGGTVADKDDNDIRQGATPKENDTIKVHADFSDVFADLTEGSIVIKRQDTKIKLWKNSYKGGEDQEIVFDAAGNTEKIYDLADETARTEFLTDIHNNDLWIEGFQPSESPKDTSLQLTYRDPNDKEVHSDTVKLTVFDSELKTYKQDNTEVKMDKEIEPGNYIVYNNDDDDGDDIKDVDDAGPITNEDDLQKVHFRFGSIFDTLDKGKIIIHRNNSKLRLYKQSNKETEIPLPLPGGKIYDLAIADDRTAFADEVKNKDLYVEGAAKSDTLKDAQFTLKYTDDDNIDICTDPVNYTVLEVDIDIDGVADDKEESVGAFIALNDNDDNDNKIADKDEIGPVNSESNTKRINLSISSAMNTGQAKLEATAGAANIKIWTVSTKGAANLITLTKTWDLSTESLPASLYVEGIGHSSSIRNIELKLSYTGASTTFDDKVKLTVIDVDFIENTSHVYGYDDYTDFDYPYKSVKITASDPVWANISGAALASSVYFKSTDTAKFTVTPAQAVDGFQVVTFTGVAEITKDSTEETRALLGSNDASGEIAAKIGLAVFVEDTYTLAVIVVNEDDDDVQVIPVGKGEPNQIAITAGANTTLDTTPSGDDVVLGTTITTGPDGVCNTTISEDDVQGIPVGNGKANGTCITAGTNNKRDTNTSGDDAVSGENIHTGTDGICNTTADNTDDDSDDPYTEAELKDYLTTVYRQSVVKWTVVDKLADCDCNFDLNRDGKIDVTPPWKTAEMDVVIDNCKNAGYDYNIFLVDNPSDGSLGFMDYGQMYGFVHADRSSFDENTTAHELGHGAFSLTHSAATDVDNLMHEDKPSPVKLRKGQWDDIQN